MRVIIAVVTLARFVNRHGYGNAVALDQLRRESLGDALPVVRRKQRRQGQFYLTGERAPYYDSDAKGTWVGLTVRHGRPHLIRSILEGASYAMRDSLELIREMGVNIEQIRVSGGGARSSLWRQIQADIYGVDVHTVNATEGPAFGVALLAMVGAGIFASVPEACDATIKVVETTATKASAKAVHERMYPIYRKLYQDLKATFGDIAKAVGH